MEKYKSDTFRRSECAVSMALDAVGDKWSLLILRDLMFSNKRGDFQASEERIATNILAACLGFAGSKRFDPKGHKQARFKTSFIFFN